MPSKVHKKHKAPNQPLEFRTLNDEWVLFGCGSVAGWGVQTKAPVGKYIYIYHTLSVWDGGIQHHDFLYICVQSSSQQIIRPNPPYDKKKSWDGSNKFGPLMHYPLKLVPSLKLTVRPWKWMVGILLSLFWWPIFRCELLVSGRVDIFGVSSDANINISWSYAKNWVIDRCWGKGDCPKVPPSSSIYSHLGSKFVEIYCWCFFSGGLQR